MVLLFGMRMASSAAEVCGKTRVILGVAKDFKEIGQTLLDTSDETVTDGTGEEWRVCGILALSHGMIKEVIIRGTLVATYLVP